MNNVLVVCAHPDDASIFCGGTLLIEKEIGSNIHILSLASPKNSQEETQISDYIQYTNFCFETLGYSSKITNSKNYFSSIITDKLCALNPSIILTHWMKDTHPRHQDTFNLLKDALVHFVIRNKGLLKTDIFSFDTYWNIGYDRTIFTPDCYVNISDVWQKKLKSIEIFSNKYTSLWLEMATLTNKLNGKRVGADYAESFIKISNFASLGGGERPKNSLSAS